MVLSSLLLAALPLASAHFQITWPQGRGFDDDTATQWPCGGFNTVNATRAQLPLNSFFPIQLHMEHTAVHGEVVLALGNDPTGDDFNIVLKIPFQETGPNSFCIGDVIVPADLNLTSGANGTIQVLTNGDPDGGVYNCVDVTFTDMTLSASDYSSHCTNSSGVTASFIGGASPNVTGGDSSSATGVAGSSATASSASASAAGASSASSSAWAPAQATAGGMLLGVAGILGGLALV